MSGACCSIAVKFEMFLLPGTHRRMGWHWQVKTFDLNQPQVQIDHLELLLQTHAHSMNEYFYGSAYGP